MLRQLWKRFHHADLLPAVAVLFLFLPILLADGSASADENGAVPRFPPTIDCLTSNDALCQPGLPSGVKTFSFEQALAKRAECERGGLRACYELCVRRLNGNRPGYSCPVWLHQNELKADLRVIAGAYVCDTIQDEERATALDNESDDAVRAWIAKNHKPCTFLTDASDARKIRVEHEYLYLVAIKSEHWRKRWVEGVLLSEVPPGR